MLDISIIMTIRQYFNVGNHGRIASCYPELFMPSFELSITLKYS